MADRRTFEADTQVQKPQRAVWAAPFVLLVAVGAGLAAAYPNLRPGADRQVEDASGAAVPATTQAAEAGQRSGASAPAADLPESLHSAAAGLQQAARVVTGNARALEPADAMPEGNGASTRVDVADGAADPEGDVSALPVAVTVVRGRAQQPMTQDDGLPASAEPLPVMVAGISFGLCREMPFLDCVVDGDTFYHRGDPVRIADIDAPEIRTPECLREAELGARATYRLLALLNAGRFEMVPPDGAQDNAVTDDYGRALRLVRRDGRSLGDILVGEGLARAWDAPATHWCG